MKRIFVWILVLAMMLSLCACGVKEEDVLGLWQRETVYLSYYDCETVLYIVFADTGEYMQMLVSHDLGDLLNMDTGVWEIIDGEIVCYDEEDPYAATIFQYDNGKLQNGDFEFTWVGRADDFIDALG